MKRVFSRCLDYLLCFVLLSVVCMPCKAQIRYSDFSHPSGVNIIPSASIVNSRLRMTQLQANTTGNAWYATRLDASAGWQARFRFQYSNLQGITDANGNRGCDGIVFAIQPLSETHQVTTWNMNALAVVFDAFDNVETDDVSSSRVEVRLNGTRLGQTDVEPLGIRFREEGVHEAIITYTSGILSIALNGHTIAAYEELNLASLSSAYFGFHGYCGLAQAYHDVLDWSVRWENRLIVSQHGSLNGINAISQFTLSGGSLGSLNTPGINSPTGLALNADGRLFVSSMGEDKIRVYSADGDDLGIFASDGLSLPHGLAFDAQGNLNVANYGNSTVRKLDATGADLGIVTNQAWGPTYMAFDSTGYLFVSAYNSHVVSKFAPDGTEVMYYQSGIRNPQGLAFDKQGNLYVANFGRGTIRKFSPQGTDLGDFATGLNAPTGLAIDAEENVYVADYFGGFIRKFAPNGANLGDIATGLSGPHGVAIYPVPQWKATISGRITLQNAVDQAQPITFEFRPMDGSPAFERQITLNSNRTFTLSDIPRKDYSIRVKGAKWLAKALRVNVSSGNVSNLNVSLLGGDANDDNAVDVFDLDALIRAFDAEPGDPHWATGADFNCDDGVDVFDLDLLIRNFDQVGDE